MISFLNKDIDITNKTKEEIQESLLTKTQFNPKSEPESENQSNFSPLEITDDENNKIYIFVVKVNEKEYRLLVSPNGSENTFKELTDYKMKQIKKNATFNFDYIFNVYKIKNNENPKLAEEIFKIHPDCLLPLTQVKSATSSKRKDAKNIDPIDITQRISNNILFFLIF